MHSSGPFEFSAQISNRRHPVVWSLWRCPGIFLRNHSLPLWILRFGVSCAMMPTQKITHSSFPKIPCRSLMPGTLLLALLRCLCLLVEWPWYGTTSLRMPILQTAKFSARLGTSSVLGDAVGSKHRSPFPHSHSQAQVRPLPRAVVQQAVHSNQEIVPVQHWAAFDRHTLAANSKTALVVEPAPNEDANGARSRLRTRVREEPPCSTGFGWGVGTSQTMRASGASSYSGR